MTSTQTDVIAGISTSLALKAPVRTAISSIPGGVLTGLPNIQTVSDGVVQLAENDRVLYAPGTADVKTGIYDVHNGLWTRSPDMDGARDVVQGTRVTTRSGYEWKMNTAGVVTIGTTPMLWVLNTAGGTEAGVRAIIMAERQDTPPNVKERFAHRLVATADSGHNSTNDFAAVNVPGGGLASDGTGGWMKTIGNAGVLEVLAPNMVFWGDSQAMRSANAAYNLSAITTCAFVNPIQAGIGGQNSAEILARFEADVLPFNPFILFVSAGANDVHAPALFTEAQTQANLLAIMVKIRQLKCNVVWLGPPPVNLALWPTFDAAKLAMLYRQNIFLESLCPQFGIHFINHQKLHALNYPFNLSWRNEAAVSEDGIHLNLSGQFALYHEMVAAYGLPLHVQGLKVYTGRNANLPPAGYVGPRQFAVDWGGASGVRNYRLNSAIVEAYLPAPRDGPTGPKAVTGGYGCTIDLTWPVSSPSGIASVAAIMGPYPFSRVANVSTQGCKRILAANQVMAGAVGGTETFVFFPAPVVVDAFNNLYDNTSTAGIIVNESGTYLVEFSVVLNADIACNANTAFGLRYNRIGSPVGQPNVIEMVTVDSAGAIGVGVKRSFRGTAIIDMREGDFIGVVGVIYNAGGNVTLLADPAMFPVSSEQISSHMAIVRLR